MNPKMAAKDEPLVHVDLKEAILSEVSSALDVLHARNIKDGREFNLQLVAVSDSLLAW